MKTSSDVLRAVAKRIIGIKFKGETTLDECLDEFYKIMRLYGIKQGTAWFENGEEVGRTCDAAEWTICRRLFIDQVIGFFEMQNILSEVPEDLLK